MFAPCFVVGCLVSYMIGVITLGWIALLWLCSCCHVTIGVSSSWCIGLVCGLCLLYSQVIIICFFGRSSNTSTGADPGFLKRGLCTGMGQDMGFALLILSLKYPIKMK